MNDSTLLARLAEVERLIAHVEKQIHTQNRIIADHERKGDDTSWAITVLNALLETHQVHNQQRHHLRAQLVER
jgi:uncharacterized coiled-coil protein SlyX